MIVTIPKKMSGTGTVNDIQSDQHERVLQFGEYAVLLPSWYGNGYNACRNYSEMRDAVKEYNDDGYEDIRVVDATGQLFEADVDFGDVVLEPTGQCFPIDD